MLETRWEDLRAGKGVATPGLGSETLCGADELEDSSQTGWISECILMGDKDILTS